MKDQWQQNHHFAGSMNNPIVHTDHPLLIKLLIKLFGIALKLRPGDKLLISVTRPLSEDVVSRETNQSKSDLEKKGFKRIKARQMLNEWGIGIDKPEKMAARAVLNDCIHDDYVFKRRGPIKHLWARRKDG